MRRVAVGIGPSLFALKKSGCIGQTFCRDEAFESGEPVLIVMRAIVGFTAIGGGLEFAGERCRPFFPSKVTCFGKLNSKGECLRLPRFREDWSIFVAGKTGQC